MIVWIDLETTGLDPKTDAILEVACVVTDDELCEVARFERVIHSYLAPSCAGCPTDRLDDLARKSGIDRYVIDMHRANGLWAASAASANTTHGVERLLEAFLLEHAAPAGAPDGARTEKPQLGGASVHFDRSFLSEHMPRVVALLHHRHLDTSSVNELARRTWPAVHQGRARGDGVAHRAMPDVLESIEVARYYQRALGPRLSYEEVEDFKIGLACADTESQLHTSRCQELEAVLVRVGPL